ncbi:hypothetical protein AVEN_127646-1 [Araneus ventricosus]|uniref:Uncharacterized protein n=1 Tax=Araneus ventricosus TaxID=182803 RepID=A0A4Y2SGC8_ARAVE|nr:hypothetical protein AVEN_127646-1 [Araneus ventricosus]
MKILERCVCRSPSEYSDIRPVLFVLSEMAGIALYRNPSFILGERGSLVPHTCTFTLQCTKDLGLPEKLEVSALILCDDVMSLYESNENVA